MDRIIHHLVPVLAGLIPVHDQKITAISKNHRRSINTQIIISARCRNITAVE